MKKYIAGLIVLGLVTCGSVRYGPSIIQRAMVALGTADHVVINGADGALSSEAALSPVRGGTGVANGAGETLTFTGDDTVGFTTTANSSVTLPTSGTLATLAGSEQLTNKTLLDSTTTIGDQADVSKAFVWSLGGATTAKTLTLTSSHTDNRTLTIPDATGTVALGKAPTVQTFLSGTTATYTTPTSPVPKYLRIRMIGPGGGGSGGGATTAIGSAGSTATLFSGTNVTLTANVGSGGSDGDAGSQFGGAGGTATVAGSLARQITALTGAIGGGIAVSGIIGNKYVGSMGGVSPFGGAGAGGQNGAGTAAAANTGSGGGGGSPDSAAGTSYAGAGGGSGGYLEAYVDTPGASYTYTVGEGGAGGAGGNAAGGAGGSGIIIVEEFYY